jgi:hypothetical protein
MLAMAKMGLNSFSLCPRQFRLSFLKKKEALRWKEGMRRQGVNEAKGLRGRNGGAWKGSKALDIHLLGAAGEMAVASHLGMKDFLYKETQAKKGSDDLPGIDIKTRSKHSYDLIVQRNESPDKKFVLVTIQDKTTLIHGWCYGRDAMKEEFWADPARGRPAYFVTKEHLRPMESLTNEAQML